MNVDVIGTEELAIHTYIKRGKEGIRVDVHVAPEVEDFFRNWGASAVQAVNSVGRSWKSRDGSSLQAWGIPTMRASSDDGPTFDIYGLGRSLTAMSERGQNLSFIRLIGASRPEGVSFLFDDVISYDELSALAQRIQKASTRFYDQYVRPVHLQVIVNTNIRRLE